MDGLVRHEAKALLDRRFLLAEGPFYVAKENILGWVDIKAGALLLYETDTCKLRELQTGQYLGAAVPTRGGSYLSAMTTGIYLLNEERGLKLLCRPEGLKENYRLNDGKCDPAGRFLFGTISLFKGHDQGCLFCLEPDGTCRIMLEGVKVSNGLAWSADGKTLFYIDTPTGGVDAFDYDLDKGEISNRRRIFTVNSGYPDGMTIDSCGMLWIALWGGGKVVRVDPAYGTVLAEIILPAKNVTSCCFGGADMGTLFITTSGEGFSDAGAGKIYEVCPGVSGARTVEFDDSEIIF